MKTQSPRDTHVLVDETGTPVLKGTLEEMQREESELRKSGCKQIAVAPVQSWNWSMINWGD